MTVCREGYIHDSGGRTQFSTGAVRDMQGEDKGRCDLLPLDVVGYVMESADVDFILENIQSFIDTGDIVYLKHALRLFAVYEYGSIPKMMLEVSIHYRDGARKYKPGNWKLGIPISSYISSGVRHLLKHIDGHTDEAHHRAFVWNMLGAMWTMEHLEEMNDIAGKKVEVGDDSQTEQKSIEA